VSRAAEGATSTDDARRGGLLTTLTLAPQVLGCRYGTWSRRLACAATHRSRGRPNTVSAVVLYRVCARDTGRAEDSGGFEQSATALRHELGNDRFGAVESECTDGNHRWFD